MVLSIEDSNASLSLGIAITGAVTPLATTSAAMGPFRAGGWRGRGGCHPDLKQRDLFLWVRSIGFPTNKSNVDSTISEIEVESPNHMLMGVFHMY